jgi:hypothetical protein
LINKQPVDRFTLAHAATGAVAGFLGLPPAVVIFVAIGWEFAERPLKRRFPDAFPHPSQDSLENATLDALAMVGAYYLFRRR